MTGGDSYRDFEKHNCCVIIPTYNNASTLPGVIEAVSRYTDRIIVVNDGSTDGTAEILEKVPGIKIVAFPANRGKGMALRKGFKEAVAGGYDNAVTIDSDGQHFADDIPAFFEKLDAAPGSLIVGARNMDQSSVPGKSSFGHRFSNFWYRFETGIALPDTQSGFRLYPVKKMDALHFFTTKYEFEIEVLVKSAWAGIPVTSVPIKVFYAEKGKRVSHFRPFRDFSRVSFLNTWLVLLALLWYIPKRWLTGLKKKTSGRLSGTLSPIQTSPYLSNPLR